MPKKLPPTFLFKVRIQLDHYEHMKNIVEMETVNRGYNVTLAELVRDALNFTYLDNELMRESFRRSRRMRLAKKKILNLKKIKTRVKKS